MLTFAFCTYNRADRLERLVAAMREQASSLPFEILAVNNNSTDRTADVLDGLSQAPGAPLRWVNEPEQGIVPARNRAIEESLGSSILVFIDDDEVPLPGLLETAVRAILEEGADSVGGRVIVDFSENPRPAWLGDELLGFLAEVDHGNSPFWIQDASTPVWTANVAYDMDLFRGEPALRFDGRFNRAGKVFGGGEDVAMFEALLDRRARIRYEPKMQVLHSVEPWRLRRRYFLALHYHAGIRYGTYRVPSYSKTILGIPPFLVSQLTKQVLKTASILITRKEPALRQAMNASHALGTIRGYLKKAGAVE